MTTSHSSFRPDPTHDIEDMLRQSANAARVAPTPLLAERIMHAIDHDAPAARWRSRPNGLYALAASITLMALAAVAAILTQREHTDSSRVNDDGPRVIATTLLQLPRLPEAAARIRFEEPLVREVRTLARHAELKYAQWRERVRQLPTLTPSVDHNPSAPDHEAEQGA